MKINEGFVKTQKTNDLVIPPNIKPLSKEDLDLVSKEIDRVVKDGNLNSLLDMSDKVL